MNGRKRESLREAVRLLGQASSIVGDVRSQEWDAIDNLPEGLRATERCEAMEAAVDSMDEARDYIDEARDCLASAMEA